MTFADLGSKACVGVGPDISHSVTVGPQGEWKEAVYLAGCHLAGMDRNSNSRRSKKLLWVASSVPCEALYFVLEPTQTKVQRRAPVVATLQGLHPSPITNLVCARKYPPKRTARLADSAIVANWQFVDVPLTPCELRGDGRPLNPGCRLPLPLLMLRLCKPISHRLWAQAPWLGATGSYFHGSAVAGLLLALSRIALFSWDG